jgi:hypothetical protein
LATKHEAVRTKTFSCESGIGEHAWPGTESFVGVLLRAQHTHYPVQNNAGPPALEIIAAKYIFDDTVTALFE